MSLSLCFSFVLCFWIWWGKKEETWVRKRSVREMMCYWIVYQDAGKSLWKIKILIHLFVLDGFIHSHLQLIMTPECENMLSLSLFSQMTGTDVKNNLKTWLKLTFPPICAPLWQVPNQHTDILTQYWKGLEDKRLCQSGCLFTGSDKYCYLKLLSDKLDNTHSLCLTLTHTHTDTSLPNHLTTRSLLCCVMTL